MKKIFYEKVGRKYVPISEYDSNLMDAFSHGTHLIHCYPGGKTTYYRIEPAYAPMIAAGRVAEYEIHKALHKASEIRPQSTPITPGQKRAWKKLAKEFGDDLCTLNGPSTHDIAEAGVKAMQAEAEKLMNNPAVKKAYEHFLLVAELTKD
jgi:hypothetical protein